MTDPSYAEITQSRSFIAYQQFFIEQQKIINQDIIFDVEAQYDTKEERLNALQETIRIAEAKAAFLHQIGEYLDTRNLRLIETKDEFSSQLIAFIQRQDADPKVKENFIALARFEAANDIEAIREKIFDEFPTLKVEQLEEVLQQYDMSR